MSQHNPIDSELSALIKEASEWAKRDPQPTNNGKNHPEEALEERDACLTAIANAITNYVTDEIMRRLVVPSEPTPPILRAPPATPLRSQSRCTTPLGSRPRSSSTTRPKVAGSQPATPIMSRSIRTNLQKSSVYHSENRLDRFSPAPRTHETPLENKASRLRRLSVERKLSRS